MEKYTELLNLGNNGKKGVACNEIQGKVNSKFGKFVDIKASKAFEI